MDSLWGEEFSLDETKIKTKKIIHKLKSKVTAEVSTEKLINSKKVSIEEKLKLVEQEVYQILGKQKDNILVIHTRKELHDYILNSINYGRIAIDTETNNSLDPITCKLMGLCLYYKGAKQVYVPVNHINRDTKERLENQLTELDINEELNYLVEAHKENRVKIIFHNGKFDYEVIKMTCNIELPIDWDTMIAAKLLDENEKSAGLKQQYIDKIDPEQEKYDIEHLFKKLPYEIVDPDIFGIYSATDAYMTDRLYEWQEEKFKSKSLSRVLWVLENIEIPVIPVVAKMELNGVTFDTEYSERLSKKYNQKLEDLDIEVNKELDKLKPQIAAWRLTDEANHKEIKNGKEQKSKNEQLDEEINLGSPLQLAILLYDVLKVKSVSKKSPRGTGEEVLSKLSKSIPLCALLLKRRELVKLIDSFIDSLPKKVNIDGKIHAHFNQFGTVTGRFSSSDPNLQQIPSHNKELRMLFRARTEYNDIEEVDNSFDVSTLQDVLTPTGWVKAKCLKVGDLICGDDWQDTIKNIVYSDNKIIIKI